MENLLHRLRSLPPGLRVLVGVVALAALLALSGGIGAMATMVLGGGGGGSGSPEVGEREQGGERQQSTSPRTGETTRQQEGGEQRSTSPRKDEAEYLAEVGDIQKGSVEAFLESDESLRRYDALGADDVEDMRANSAVLRDYRDRVAGLDPPERHRGQHEVFGLAIGELHEATEVAYRVVNDPASATQSHFAAYDDHVDNAAAQLRRSNEMIRRDYATIEGA
jgi:hypothetical protein